jgi:lipopolysaccharide assembly protein B
MPASDGSGILILVLLFAAAGGYLAARLTGRPRPPSDRTISEEYFQGLNFVLSEEPDRALEVFLRMSEVDDETVELHFTLGNLYRRRGEVDRAIRVHENILERENLTTQHREHAMFALGEDYFRAGLFDRSEHLFERLADESSRKPAALRYLLRIREQQRDWREAINVHRRFEVLAAPEHPTAIAHYHCELAEAAIARGDDAAARALLREAREAQRNFPRGALLRAGIALSENDAALAVRLCRRVVDLHPQLLPITLPRLVAALDAEGGQTAERMLYDLTRTNPVRRAEIAYAGIVSSVYERPAILECVRDLLREDPNLGDLVPAFAAEPFADPASQLLPLARALARVFRRSQKYRCVECGFATASHFWQCPGCRAWDALAPVAGLELAPMARAR